jgi:CRP/FNR family transcriptional regulator, cyclic AMP receptor protein
MSEEPQQPPPREADPGAAAAAADGDIDLGEHANGAGAGTHVDAAPSEASGETPSGPIAQASIPPEKAVELLSKISLFSSLQPTYLRRIASLGLEEDYGLNSLIFQEGAQGDKMYLILSGAVRISRQVPGMGEEALAVLRAGTHFGEMALIDDFPRSADARAHEACRLFVIRKEDMEDLLFVDRDLAYDLLWTFVRTLSNRLRETNDKMTFMAVSAKF